MQKSTLIFVICLLATLFGACKTEKVIPDDPHFLPIKGAYNVRDLGGYKTADGRQVKWNKVFRSGDLNKLTDEDLSVFNAIPIKTYIDFRDPKEIAKAPDLKPKSLVNQYFFPIETGDMINFKKITPKQAPTLLVEGNRHFVRDNQVEYRQFFKILMEESNAPLLFHCSAGKDRAGFAAALFLSSLGVDRETIIEDYLLSNEGIKGKYDTLMKIIPMLKHLLTARREYIQAAFDVIDQEYGGMENYLINNLGVDLEKMRQMYTEKENE